VESITEVRSLTAGPVTTDPVAAPGPPLSLTGPPAVSPAAPAPAPTGPAAGAVPLTRRTSNRPPRLSGMPGAGVRQGS
jgi:hypothetical protein